MDPKLTIIVPVYNAEAYLQRCIDSISDQTFRDFECLLVDDGSTDSSLDICRKAEQEDPRFHALHQNNSGVSVARNTGLDAAKGRWIGFVDSDDWIEKETYQIAIRAAEETDSDCVQWNFDIPGKSDSFIEKYARRESQEFKMKRNTVIKWNKYSVWTQLFKTEIIRGNNIRFTPGINIGEDRHFSFCNMACCKKIWELNDVLYHYFVNTDGLTHSEYSIKKIHQDVAALKETEKFLCDHYGKEDNLFSKTIRYTKIGIKTNYLSLVDSPDMDQWKEIFPEMNWKSVFIPRKVALIDLLIMLHLYGPAELLVNRLLK